MPRKLLAISTEQTKLKRWRKALSAALFDVQPAKNGRRNNLAKRAVKAEGKTSAA